MVITGHVCCSQTTLKSLCSKWGKNKGTLRKQVSGETSSAPGLTLGHCVTASAKRNRLGNTAGPLWRFCLYLGCLPPVWPRTGTSTSLPLSGSFSGLPLCSTRDKNVQTLSPKSSVPTMPDCIGMEISTDTRAIPAERAGAIQLRTLTQSVVLVGLFQVLL